MSRGRTARGGQPFCPPRAGTPEERLAAFVELAQELRRHGRGCGFHDCRWDVTDTVARRAGVPAQPGRICIVFAAEGAAAIGPFIRSYVGMLPTVGRSRLAACAAAGGLLAQAMDTLGVATIAAINVAVMNEAAALAGILHPGDRGARLAGAVREIGAFLQSQGMTRSSLVGTLPLPVQAPAPARFEEAYVARSRRLLPSDRFLEAVADAHRLAADPADVIVTRIGLILMSAPGRINEALGLDEEPEVERAFGGVPILGLRWRGSKGAEDGVKWVVPSMAPAVRDACGDLRRVTAEGRRIKAWYGCNPNSLYLPPALASLRAKDRLTPEECGALLGRRPGPGQFGAAHGVTFADLEAHLLGLLPAKMRDAGGPAARPLLVVPWGTFDAARRPPCPCMFETVKYRHVADALGGGNGLGGALFRRLGLDPGGEIGGRTHALRHWLITLALRGGLPAAEVAAWSGRASPRANRSYDHRTAAEMRAAVSRASAASRRTTSPLALTALTVQAAAPAGTDVPA